MAIGKDRLEGGAIAPGSFGHSGASVRQTTSRAIRGTQDDPLYQSMRAGMRVYRFTVPLDGTYTVQLRFAEFEHKRNGARVFTIFVEGGRTFLLYAAAGEYGLAIAEVSD